MTSTQYARLDGYFLEVRTRFSEAKERLQADGTARANSNFYPYVSAAFGHSDAHEIKTSRFPHQTFHHNARSIPGEEVASS